MLQRIHSTVGRYRVSGSHNWLLFRESKLSPGLTDFWHLASKLRTLEYPKRSLSTNVTIVISPPDPCVSSLWCWRLLLVKYCEHFNRDSPSSQIKSSTPGYAMKMLEPNFNWFSLLLHSFILSWHVYNIWYEYIYYKHIWFMINWLL